MVSKLPTDPFAGPKRLLGDGMWPKWLAWDFLTCCLCRLYVTAPPPRQTSRGVLPAQAGPHTPLIAVAPVQVPSGSKRRAEELVQQQAGALRAEFGSLEQGMHIELAAAGDAAHERVLSAASARRLLALLLLLPHGVVKKSHAVPGAPCACQLVQMLM